MEMRVGVCHERTPESPIWHQTLDGQGQQQDKTAWTFPSGRRCQVTITRCLTGCQEVTFTWNAPPTDRGDLESFLLEVLPEILEHAALVQHSRLLGHTIRRARGLISADAVPCIASYSFLPEA